METIKSFDVLEINTDLTPYLLFNGAQIECHKKNGKVTLDFNKLHFYLSEKQKNCDCIEGHKLRVELESKNVINACFLDFLMDKPYLIPESWKKDEKGNTLFICFWGTIFRGSNDRLYVRFLYFDNVVWRTGFSYLDLDWGGHELALLSVE